MTRRTPKNRAGPALGLGLLAVLPLALSCGSGDTDVTPGAEVEVEAAPLAELVVDPRNEG